MRYLIYGNGWIGNRFDQWLKGMGFESKVSTLNILDTNAVAVEISNYSPDVVVNAAGVCGSPNIDWCEQTEANKKLTMLVNGYGPRILESVVEDNSFARFVHISSGCLWDRPYDLAEIGETEMVEPVSWYSKTKVAGESNLSWHSLIARIRMPVDFIPNPRNLIDKLASYKQVLDCPNSVTILESMFRKIVYMVDHSLGGVFHLVDGNVSGTELMTIYQSFVDPNHVFEPITYDQLKTLVKTGRSNCVLSSRLSMPVESQESFFKTLSRLMVKYGEYKNNPDFSRNI